MNAKAFIINYLKALADTQIRDLLPGRLIMLFAVLMNLWMIVQDGWDMAGAKRNIVIVFAG